MIALYLIVRFTLAYLRAVVIVALALAVLAWRAVRWSYLAARHYMEAIRDRW